MLPPKFLKLSSKAFIAAVALIVLWRLYDGLFLAERHMDELFKETKTLCVGRFEITLPASADVSLTGTYNRVSASKDSRYLSFNDMISDVEAKAERMKGVKMNYYTEDLGALNRFRAKNGVPLAYMSPNQLVNFSNFSESEYVNIAYFKNNMSPDLLVERHQFINNWDIVFTTISGHGAQDFEPMVEIIASTAEKFHPYRDENDRRADEPAYCLGDGYFAASADPEIDERFSLYVTFPNLLPDVHFSLSAQTVHRLPKGEPSLLERTTTDISNYSKFFVGIRIQDQSDRRYAGLEGQRVFTTYPTEDSAFRRDQKVMWEVQGGVADPSRPAIQAELMTGESLKDETKRSNLDDGEVVALFERIMKSLVLRPDAL